MPITVLIPDRFAPPPDIEQAVLGPDAVLLMPGVREARDVPDEMWRAADGLLVWHDVEVDAEAIARLDRCRVIVRVGAGFDNVDLAAAGARGIYVCNVPDYGTNDVADHAIGLLLALYRGLLELEAFVRGGGWEWQAWPRRRRVGGETLGVIGLGRIGTATAMRARALGMRVVFYDPYKDDGYDKALGLERAFDLNEVLGQADAVTFHVPLTGETRGMAGDEFFAALKEGAFLVNTARGPVVDLDALERALRSGRVQAAALDVLPQEPPDPEHPLLRAWRAGDAQGAWLRWRLIVTPHAAFYNEASFAEVRRKAAQEAARVLNGQPPRNCVNREYLKPRS